MYLLQGAKLGKINIYNVPIMKLTITYMIFL